MSIIGNLSISDVIFDGDEGVTELNGSIRMDTVILNGEVYIFASSWSDNGIQVLKMGSDGQLTAVDTGEFIDNPAELEVVTVGDRLFLLATSTDDDEIQSYEITTSGDDTGHLTFIEDVDEGPDPINQLDRPDYVEAFYTSNGSFVAVAANNESAVFIYQVSENGNLIWVDSAVTTDGASDLSVHTIGSRTFVYASSGNAAFEVADDGTLTEVVGSVAPFGGEPVETINIDGADLMVTANNDGVFGVFSLASDGTPTFLTSYDANVNDGVADLRQFEIVKIEGATYIISIIGNGVGVFSLTADGTIALVQSIDSETDLAFGFGLDYQEIDGHHYILYNAFDADAVASIEIGGGDDILTGTSGDDNIAGLAGDDTLSGLGGDDAMTGGIGDDVLRPGTGSDVVDGGAGSDTVDYSDTGEIAVRLFGNRSVGDGFRDTLISIENAIGSGFNDFLAGSSVANRIEGGDGDDRIIGYAGEDVLYGGLNADTMRGGQDNDWLDGEDGDDRLQGELGEDTLLGGAGEDFLFGGNGSDVLNGGADDDLLSGGSHADVFVFETGGGFDRIIDWQDGTDVVDLTDFGFSDFSEVEALASQVNAGVRLEFVSGDVLQFADMVLADLSADDFILA